MTTGNRPRPTLAEVMRWRRTPGATALVHLTDRCPVGCAHCSVSARPDSPRPADPALLAALLDGLTARPGLRAVAVSGGEPFTERRGLTLTVDRLADTGLAVVLYTSGHWAGPSGAPAWAARVLARTGTVFVGTDDQHLARLGPDRLRRAVGAITGAGCRLVLQVIDLPGRLDAARQILTDELGPHWDGLAELHPTRPLALGRGAAVFARPPARPATAFGPCLPALAPTVRHDGTVTACCNEDVVTGAGPAALRRTATGADGLTAALDGYARDPLLRVMAATGPGVLAGLPGFAALADPVHRTVCEACWAAHDAVAADPRAAAVAAALAPAVREGAP